MVWPVLVILLYATFTQVPLTSIRSAFTDRRFLATALAGNSVVLPAIVWGLVQFIPDIDALRLGLLLVLVVPCTDWFITFSQLGRADSARAIALTPPTLILQLLLLPVYLRLIGGTDLIAVFTIRDVWPAFVVILAPLIAAAITEIWASGRPTRQRLRAHLGWWPVPSLAAVIFLVAAAHSGPARDDAHLLPVVIVMQSLVELLGMIFYLWFVPRVLFPDRAKQPD
ncbi:hypothetical protein [Phytoactinopolyspora mesophila]|uniref:hypothetical protein n=1 Tax=Phytoactinopolyspora mesophila TaxID=2650750 RepID=UPI001C9E4BCC|nr:hypothetical protein [Phytoactinopolyspora mesophila]